MRLRDYPFGKPTKALAKAVSWINKNKIAIQANQKYAFDHPDFWGMPASLSSNLTEDEIDFIAGATFDLWWPNQLQYLHQLRSIQL